MLEFVRHLRLMTAIVKTKPGNLGLRRPIRLRLREHTREQREHERRRMLAFKNRVTEVAEAEFFSKLSHRFRRMSALRDVEQNFRDSWTKHSDFAQPLPEWWHR